MSELSAWIFRATWQASCLAVAVFLIQWLLGSRLSARGRSVLWLIVIARLVMPPLPTIRWSYFHARTVATTATVKPAPVAAELPTFSIPLDSLATPPQRVFETKRDLVANPPPVTQPQATAMPMIAATPPAAPTPPNVPLWPRIVRTLPWLWLAGAILFLARLIIVSLRLALTLRRAKPTDDPRVTAIVRSAAAELRLRRIPPVLAADRFPGPAVAGWLRPRLLLPTSVAESFSDDDLRMMVLHELAHVRRRDVLFNWFLALLNAAHWFNPILWLTWRRIRADRELACDELVMSTTQADAHHRYGHTLLRLADWLAHHNPSRRVATAGVLGILEDSNDLKRRIVMISRFNPTNRHRFSLAASSLALLLTSAALIDAAEPGAPSASDRASDDNTKAMHKTSADVQDSDTSSIAERMRVKRLKLLLEEKLKNAQDALSEQERLTKQSHARVDGAGAPYIEKPRSDADLAEARLAVTDANMELAKVADPQRVKQYLQEKVTQAQDLVKACEELTKIAQQMGGAGLQLDASDTKAPLRLAAAKSLLIDAKIAADAQAPVTRTAAKSAAGLWEEKALEIRDDLKDMQERQHLLKSKYEAGSIDQVTLKQAEAAIASREMDLSDATIAMIEHSPNPQPEQLKKYRQQKLDQAKKFLRIRTDVVTLMKMDEQYGLNESKVSDAEAAAAKAARLLTIAQQEANGRSDQPRVSETDSRVIQQEVLAYKTAAAKARLDGIKAFIADIESHPNHTELPAELKADLADAQATYAEAKLKEQQAVAPVATNLPPVATLPPAGPVSEFQKDVEALAQLETQYAPNHPKVVALRSKLRVATITRMQQMMVAVKLYDQERGGMPKGFHIPELAEMVNFNANENPRLPYLTYGYRWIAPDVKRLADIKDPAHTPIFCEVTPQPDGKMLVAYADGHVGEVQGDEAKAMEKLDRAQHNAVAEITIFSGSTMTVPRELAADCQRIVEEYNQKRIIGPDGNVLNAAEVDHDTRAAIEAKINAWKKSRGLPTDDMKRPTTRSSDSNAVQEAQKHLNSLLNEGRNESHPAVIAARRELGIAELAILLQSHTRDGPANPIDELTDAQIGMVDLQMAAYLSSLRAAEANLAKMKTLYPETHPSVVAAQNSVQHAADSVSNYASQWRSLVKKIAFQKMNATTPAPKADQKGQQF